MGICHKRALSRNKKCATIAFYGYFVEVRLLIFGGVILNKRTKNILGILSILTVIVSIIFFFLIRGPNADLTLGISVFTVLSILGIIFAILSKKRWFIITGVILNGAVLVFAYFLLLAVGISEP